VYVLTAPGATWQQFTSGLYLEYVKCLAADQGNAVLAGTWGAGVYRSSGSAATGVSESPAAGPESPAVVRLFPNPFNGFLTVEYELAADTDVEMTVFDAAGRFVDRPVRGRKTAGVHSEVWDASSAPSGKYLVRLKSGGTTATAACTLVK
jgi:hypothetical protein